MFKGAWAADDARWIFPHLYQHVAFSDLGSGASDEISLGTFPANAKLVDGAWYNKTAWTSGSGDTTGLDVSIGDDDVDAVLEELDLIGAATGWSKLGGVAAGFVAFQIEATAFAGVISFVPTGAGSEDLDDINAGEGVGIVWYWTLPDGDDLYAQSVLDG